MAKPKIREQKTTIKVSLEQRPDFKGEVAAFVFDVAGNLLERADVKAGKVTLPLSEVKLIGTPPSSVIMRMYSSCFRSGRRALLWPKVTAKVFCPRR